MRLPILLPKQKVVTIKILRFTESKIGSSKEAIQKAMAQAADKWSQSSTPNPSQLAQSDSQHQAPWKSVREEESQTTPNSSSSKLTPIILTVNTPTSQQSQKAWTSSTKLKSATKSSELLLNKLKMTCSILNMQLPLQANHPRA